MGTVPLMLGTFYCSRKYVTSIKMTIKELKEKFEAIEYALVLSSSEIEPVVIGRSERSATAFREATGIEAETGGLDIFLKTNKERPHAVIIAINAVELANATRLVLDYCQPERVLVERPGFLTRVECEQVLSCQGVEQVYIAYNRRFYASTSKLIKMLEADGGPTSCSFEFTEWTHRFEPLLESEHPYEMKYWLVCNSSHVIDLAFYLIGKPESLHAEERGGLSWHPSASVFSGAGVSETGACFNYQANWIAPGRWTVEVMSAHRRYRLCPLESLQVQEQGQLDWSDVEIDGGMDATYKPVLYHMVSDFLNKPDSDVLCRFDEHVEHYCEIAGY